jgi:hypothetical protein
MTDWQLLVGISAVVVWASLPVSVIYSMAIFDHDVVREGEKAGDH